MNSLKNSSQATSQDIGPKLDEMIRAQQQTNLLLTALLELMADDIDDGDEPVGSYLDGTPIDAD